MVVVGGAKEMGKKFTDSKLKVEVKMSVCADIIKIC